ncbi:MAG: Multifunctional CCA protein [Firmicutes bacterium ADurb.Bin248]|nr:MAG: Multifunctional CCA protein [Firmicutes bacterium ADurb.Bin248]
MKSFPLSQNLMRLARAFREAGHTLYAVGGMVRNPLLGLPVSDADVCSAMRPDGVKALCEKEGFGCFPKGAAFGTLDLVAGCGAAREKFEYACFRSESYGRGGAHRPERIAYSDSLEQDAFRRDFTINAIYLDILESRVVDPTGGMADLQRKRVRATSPDPGLIMGDDALRILRMARFAAQLGFTIDPATMDAARAHARGLLDISPERIWEELTKLLLADARYGAGRESLLYGLEALQACGAYETMLPELAACAGVAQKAQYHAYDVLGHSLRATAVAPPALSIRLAMLLHDVGKPVSLAQSGSMHGHELSGAELADAALRRLRCPNALRREVMTLVRWHMYDLKGEARECKVRRRFVELGRDIAHKLCDVREADVHGSGLWEGPVPTAERWRDILSQMEREGAPFTEGELACTGDDIAAWLSIRPGARIGEIKRALLMHCACKPGDNTGEKLRALARDMQRGSACDN